MTQPFDHTHPDFGAAARAFPGVNGRVNGHATATGPPPVRVTSGAPPERLAGKRRRRWAPSRPATGGRGPVAAPYINLAELAEVVGAQESFKSWFVADLARAVFTGGLWLGSIRVDQGGVFYVEQERARNLAYQMALLGAGWGQDWAGSPPWRPAGSTSPTRSGRGPSSRRWSGSAPGWW